MPIETRCQNCGKLLRAPDSAAGRRAKCPACGEAVQLPDTEPVFDAEPVDADDYEVDSPWSEREEADANEGYADESVAEDDVRTRKPCPVCGEMIVASARKCRFCGEILGDGYGIGRGSENFSRTKLERFRKEIHGLGGFWIFIGGLAIVFGIILATGRGNRLPEEFFMILIPLAVLWIIIGIFTCLKHLWAVYVGLVLSYLSVIGNVINIGENQGGGVCGIILMIAAIIQAHRVIGWANEMRAAGVPLDARP